MNDLIKRADAIEAVLGLAQLNGRVPTDSVIFQIKALPSARPTGEWIDVKMDYGECSECGFFGITTDYCPNCGARMKGGAE